MDINENKTSSATQCGQILAHLREGRAITSLEALQMFGCMRLASRIHDLRERGYDISVTKVHTGYGKVVAQYRLVP